MNLSRLTVATLHQQAGPVDHASIAAALDLHNDDLVTTVLRAAW